MGMGIGINTQNPDEGRMKRILEEIACGVWFTSKGDVLPKLVKFQDRDGMIRCISGIRVLTHEKKFYCGIPIHEYECRAIDGAREYFFHLYYYAETNRWKLSWDC